MKVSVTAKDITMLKRVFTDRQLNEIRRLANDEIDVFPSEILETGDEEIIFSTWGIPKINLEGHKNLKAVFYGAGSVQSFAREMLEGGVRVFSAWHANAVPVAEYAFAQIILSLKGFVPVMNECRDNRQASYERFSKYPGAYRAKVGLLGLGAIGSRVAKFLMNTDTDVYAFDPFASAEKAKSLNVQLIGLDKIFETCDVISNHIANLPETKGIITRKHLLSMKSYSTFINTGRGAQLNEQDLYDALKKDETITALLDVVTDEKNFNDCILRSLPNCHFTPHIAGTAGLETERMGERMVNAYRDYLLGIGCEDEVTLKMLETMA